MDTSPPPDGFPPVDEHLVLPEVTRDEMIRGRKVVAMPAREEHADEHADLAGVLRVHIAPGYRMSVELLTRASKASDFATDISIRKEGIEPSTGHRYLEELSFEIVNEQSMKSIRDKAEDLTRRGVRRVLAIFVRSISPTCSPS